MKVQDLMREVRIALDINNNPERLLREEDIDTLTEEEIIRSRILQAALIVSREAPLHLVGIGSDLSESPIVWDSRQRGRGSGRILLPEDFLRLITFKMSDWSYPLNNILPQSDPRIQMQRSKFVGIQGSPSRPILTLEQDAHGTWLVFHSSREGESVFIQQARYLPIPKIVDNELNINEKLIPALVHSTASLVAMSFGEDDVAGRMITISKELLK